VALGEVPSMDPEARDPTDDRDSVADRERHSPERALGLSVEEAGYLGEGEDEDKVEEQFEGCDTLFVGVSALRLYLRRADGRVLRSQDG